jgi:hypothetical protein
MEGNDLVTNCSVIVPFPMLFMCPLSSRPGVEHLCAADSEAILQYDSDSVA